MPTAPAATDQQGGVFPYPKWDQNLPALAKLYSEGKPFPHVYLADFLDSEFALPASAEFPRPDTEAWTHYKHHNENKMGLTKRDLFPPLLGEVADELNSPEFVEWLSELTGIPGLVADPDLEGGGLHQSGRGGFLNIHADFTMHHYHKHWRRRVNLILYLNQGWRPEWGGAIELWDEKMQHCAVKFPPLLNHALIFRTDERSHHGFPEPLRCPPEVSRKSLALYYYTADDAKSAPRSTNYRARPEDSLAKAVMIWLDKKAIALYSRAKARFGFSDDIASKILGKLFGKK
jgi:hypothetical protein